MIFLSHNSKDKPVVERIATALAAAFGRENVFYDSWSIQPGDGIIAKMNEGLAEAKFLFLFVSRNSLASDMVSLEWQNGVYKSVKGGLKIVPLRLDDSPMPAVLMQSLYIDVVNHGIEVAIRQMIDVVKGNNTFRPMSERFDNVRAYLTRSGGKTRLEMRAEAFMEPQSRYVILFPSGTDKPRHEVKGEAMHEQGWNPDTTLDDGSKHDALLIGVSRATSLGFPVVVELDGNLTINGVMRAVSHENFQGIPLIGPRLVPSMSINFGEINFLADSPLTRGAG